MKRAWFRLEPSFEPYLGGFFHKNASDAFERIKIWDVKHKDCFGLDGSRNCRPFLAALKLETLLNLTFRDLEARVISNLIRAKKQISCSHPDYNPAY